MADLTRKIDVSRWHKTGYAGGFSSVRISDPQVQQAIQSIDGILTRRFGNGPITERAVTWADLAKNGIAELNIGGKIIGRRPGDDPPFANPIPTPSRPETPHQPTGLVGYGTTRTVILTWDATTYAGHAYTEVYKATFPQTVFNDAVFAGRSNSRVYADRIGAGAVTSYYWIRHVNELGEAGVFTQIGLEVTTGTAGEGDVAEAHDLLVADKGIIVEALIGDAEIGGAKIQDASIESAKIVSLAANKITAGSIQVNQYIQSANYSSGVSGWHIHGNGAAEFRDLVIRASIVAGSTIEAPVITGGTINGGTINGGTMNAATINASSILGTNIVGGTFWGNLLASTDGTRYLSFDGFNGFILNTPTAKIYADGRTQFSNAVAVAAGFNTGLPIDADQWVQVDPGVGNGWVNQS